jgi:hypothetical protein
MKGYLRMELLETIWALFWIVFGFTMLAAGVFAYFDTKD